MYQVVASDLDGTLLSPDHTLSPYAKETLKLLTARGVNFVFATGRHHVDVGQIRDNLEIKSYMITSNGARVHDTDGNLIFTHNLDRDIAADLFGVVHNNPDIVTNVYRDDEWFMNRHRPDEMRFFKEAVFNYSLYEPGLLDPEGISKVFFTCESHEELLPLEQAINARWGDRVRVASAGSQPTRVNTYAIEVMRERGLDLGSHYSKAVTTIDPASVDLVITLCADEVCPLFLSKAPRLHWPLRDPASDDPALSRDDMLDRFRQTADAIETRLAELDGRA